MTSLDPSVHAQLQAAAAQATQQQAAQAAGVQAAYPLDVQMFLDMFPTILAGCLKGSANVNDAISSAMEGARAALGQYVQMGILPPAQCSRLPDGSYLAKTPNTPMNGHPMPIQQNGGGMVQPGNFVGQVPTNALQPIKSM